MVFSPSSLILFNYYLPLSEALGGNSSMKKVRINKENYSDSSKNSVGHEFLGEYYEDIHYNCSKCHKPAVFNAQEQKDAFEARKEYMWSQRVLCHLCWKEMRGIKKELEAQDNIYHQKKEAVLRDKEFLENWLVLLELYPKFGKKSDTAKIGMVKNALKGT